MFLQMASLARLESWDIISQIKVRENMFNIFPSLELRVINDYWEKEN